jgi:HD-GYP domain-containing protein (c-di-GMP phosphodiesterase class II)
MTSDRPYRRALSRAEALAEVERCAGTQFDPEIARIFLELFEEAELATAASA